MKKFLLFIALGFSAFSCKKESQLPVKEKASETKYDVSFNITEFAQTTTNLSINNKQATAATTDLAAHVKFLHYRLYSDAGDLLNKADQTATAADFGTIQDKLPSGYYYVVIIASKGELNINDTKFSNLRFSDKTRMWDDTFTAVERFYVGISTFTKSLALERCVSGLEVTLEDVMPANVGSIEITIDNEAYELDAGHKNTVTNKDQIKKLYPVQASEIGKTNKSMFLFSGLNSSTTQVKLMAYDNKIPRSILSFKVIDKVSFGHNRKTVLRGKLFEQAASFKPSINPDWAGSNAEVLF